MTRFTDEWLRRRLAGSPQLVDYPVLTDAVYAPPPAPRATRLVLPWPPTGNHATKHTRTGGHYLTDEHKRFRSTVAAIWAQVKAQPVPSPYRATIVWFPPDRRARDSDNLQKTLFDALIKCGAIADDSMSHRVEYSETVSAHYAPREGACHLTLQTMAKTG